MSETVLIVGNFLSASGWTINVCEELAPRLAATGWRVVATSIEPRRWRRLTDMVFTAYGRRKDYGIAVIDVYSGRAFFWAEAVCAVLRRVKKPYVLVLHGGNLPRFAQRWPGRVRRLLRSAQAVTTPSQYLRNAVASYRDDIRVVSNGLDLQAYNFRLRSHPQPRLLWMRAFHDIYNPTMAVHVLARLAPEIPGIQLTMLGPERGDGSLESVRQEAARLNVSDRLELPGAVPKAEVPRWLEKADVFLNTTNVDNTPVSVLEAMASGLCVVSTDVGGVPYVVQQESNGLLVPPRDPEAMANAVRRVLAEPGLAERISFNARRKAETVDWPAIVKEWDSLLKKVLSDAKGRGWS
jgi:glycosyltransferase involved in cell wall biosynthesis